MATHSRASDDSSQRGYLSVAEFCRALGVSRATFYEWRAKRTGPRCLRLPNGKIRIRQADFEAWLASLEDSRT